MTFKAVFVSIFIGWVAHVLHNVGDTNLLLVVCGQALGFAGAHFDDRMVKHGANSGLPC